MYNPNILTDTERYTPPAIQAMRAEMQEMQKHPNHPLSPNYPNAYTTTEIQYPTQMPPPSGFETNPRPHLGTTRHILHAAAIFAPNHSPAPTHYQLPPRSRRYYSEFVSRSDEEELDQRRDSGYESGVYMLTSDDDDDIDAWCDAVLAQNLLVGSNEHVLRAEAAGFRPGGDMEVGARVAVGGRRRDHDDGGYSVAFSSSGHESIALASSIEDAQDERDCDRQGRCAVVLDDEGLGSRVGRCGREARSEGARSEDDEGGYDERFDEGSRARWSV